MEKKKDYCFLHNAPMRKKDWEKPKHDLLDEEYWKERRRLKKYQRKKII